MSDQHSRSKIVPLDRLKSEDQRDEQMGSRNRLEDKASQNKDKKEDEEEEEIKTVGCCELFRFANTCDKILMFFGSIAAMAVGGGMPAFAFIWGRMTDSFDDSDSMVKQSRETFLLFIYLGLGILGCAWIMFACWMIAGERQAITCRKKYLNSLLKQDIAWFDSLNQIELAAKFAKDTFAFQGAIGQKISTVIMVFATLVSGFIFAFVTGWLMTLVILAVFPALAISGGFYMSALTSKGEQDEKSYSKAGGRAAQAINSIKTVKQLGGEEFQAVEYERHLQQVSQSSCKFSVYLGLGMGAIFLTMLASYSLGFWYGSRCILQTENCPPDVAKQTYTAGDVLVVFFSVIIGGFSMSQISPAMKKIVEGRQAAARIFEVIDRVPEITNPPNGKKIENLKGIIKFENVTFSYPKDRSRKVLTNLTMEFDTKKSGLVGESGCGKSTIMQLILRFYDPDLGRVTLDGVDLKELDLDWLRQQIGYVGQEAALFATSIKENLLLGNEKATDDEIVNALKMAEAYDFVLELEDKLDTYVGFGGGQLSGGQKQRISIARAILRSPKIFLFDEATSALDRRNEKLIQETLDKISEGKTTITIAHRVKTVMNSDIIYLLDKGGIKEKGKFSEMANFKNFHDEKDENQPEEEIIAPKKQHKKKKIKEKRQNTQEFMQQGQREGEENKEDEEDEQDTIDDIFKSKEEREAEHINKINKKYEESTFGRVFSYSSEKICPFVIGILAALANGVVFPVFSIFLSKILAILLEAQISVSIGAEHSEKNLADIKLYSLLFLLFGVAAFIFTAIQTACFTYVGEDITKKIRIETYRKILKMPVPWFDIPRNNGGSLSARLETDCQLVNGVTTTTVGIGVQNISTLISGIVIALVFEWRTALVAIGLMPFMILSGLIEMSFHTGFSDKTDEAYKDSNHLIMESLINIRTVSSFGFESYISRKYDEKMVEPYDLAVFKGNISGFLFGLSQFIMYLIFGLLFFLGALFVRDNESVDVEDMFVALYAIVFAGMTAGNNSHFMPDAAACQNAASKLFEILDGEDEDQIQEKDESKMLKEGIEGDITLENVTFKYESRNEYVFRNLNMKIKYGKKTAFVGTSGCGKSTIIQLLQRFYEPEEGVIKINDIPLKDFDLRFLRETFGCVSQEPVLFNGTFRENIKYNKHNATDEDIVIAAKKANAFSFIMGEEKIVGEEETEGKGFDRSVGVRGSMISGGQKQRIAIARTIVRNPNKLLLDEATSALDTDNEKLVQDSLDKIMEGKTVISIAHRINTIKNSDEIMMFEKGKVVESGTYSELVGRKGHFYNLERGSQFT